MLDAYETLARKLEEKRAAELAPDRRAEEKRTEEAVKVATAIEPEGIGREIGQLKSELVKFLAEISERLASESGRFSSVQRAVESKERELKELYGIEKAGVTLAALLEAQNQKRAEFDAEMAREREREEFTYAFKRDQQAIKDKLNDEKATLEKEIKLKRDAAEKDLAEREKAIAEKEHELAELRAKAAAFPKDLETALSQAVEETTDRLKLEAKNREDLLRKEFEGERNVLAARNEAFERTNKDLLVANAKLAQQLEAAYQKVQIIAEKTVEGSSQSRSLAELQKLLLEQGRKAAGDKQ